MMPVIKHGAVAPQSNPNINANYYDDDYELIYFENAYIISKKGSVTGTTGTWTSHTLHAVQLQTSVLDMLTNFLKHLTTRLVT